jgi:hypothetical protein
MGKVIIPSGAALRSKPLQIGIAINRIFEVSGKIKIIAARAV